MEGRIDGGAGKYANQRALYLTILSQKTYFLRQNEVKDFAPGAFNQIELNNLSIRNEAR